MREENVPHPNQRKSHENECVLHRPDQGFRQGVRANRGGDEQSGGDAAQMQMLPQDIRQVHPSSGFGEPDDRFLRPREIGVIGAV